MPKLEELEENLYREEGKEEIEKRLGKKRFFSFPAARIPRVWESDEKLADALPPAWRRRVMNIAIAVFLLLIVSGGALFVFLYFGTRPQEVTVRIEARPEIESGEVLLVSIPYRNVSRVPLHDLEMTIILPPGTLVKEGGDEYEAPARITKTFSGIAPGEERIEEFRVRLFGREGSSETIEAAVSYRPENVSARFTARASQTVKIIRVPLGVTWDVPETLAEGQDVDILLRYSSNSRDEFPKLALRIDFPPGFTFTNANPKPSEGTNIWDIGELRAGGSGVVALRGSITGEEGEIKTFRAGIGVYRYDTKEWTPYVDSFQEVRIAVTPLFVKARLDKFGDTITPGEQLRFVLQYQNNTPFPLKNVSVRSIIEGSILQFSTLTITQGGVFDFPSRSLLWTAANTPEFRELPPGASGELVFSIATLETPPVKTAADKNLVIRLHSHIEASGVPAELLGTDLTYDEEKEFRIHSKVLFGRKAFYTYPALPNTGPLPPKVGKKTTYTIVWDLRNFTNDLVNAEVRATLPPNVRWENAVSPREAAITFTESSGEVRWRIGTIPAGQGVLSPVLLAAFRVSVVPSEVDIGKAMTLVNQATFTAEDSFTKETVERIVPLQSTHIPDDPRFSAGGLVVP